MPNIKRGMMGAAGVSQGDEKSLYAWGNNGSGSLGVRDVVQRSSPTLVGAKKDWAVFTPGQGGGWGLKYDGSIWAFGSGSYGRLGQVDTLANYSAPVQIGALKTWTHVFGARHTGFAVKDDGTLWSWGFNSQGESGQGNILNSSSPTQVGSASDWGSCTGTGSSTVGVIKSNGTLWMWGTKCGQGDTVKRSVPTQLGALDDWSKVATGGYHVLGLRTNGTLWSWGTNSKGQCGLGNTAPPSSPIQIGTRADWKDISTGRFASAGITTDGKLWTWGGASNGENGQGSVVQNSSPTQVGSLTTWNTFGAASCGIKNQILATTTGGAVWGFGRNTSFQLLDDTTTNRSSPVQVGVDAGWSSVLPGYNSMFILYP